MLLNKDKYLAHIHDSEKLSKMNRVLDKIISVEKSHISDSTDFFDPYEIRLAESILNRFINVEYEVSGGYDMAERSCILIYPDYFLNEGFEDTIKLLKITSMSNNMIDLKHPDFLGAILNLGINRDKIGDILVYDSYAIFAVKKEISDFIFYNLDRVANNKVNVEYIKEIDSFPEYEYETIKIFASSLRLDVVLSGVHNISRKDSKNLIISDKVKVDWELITNSSFELEENSMVSVRGYGRFILSEIEGKSKKDKYVISIKKLL